MDQLARQWKWFMALGILSIILGILCLLDTVIVTIASVIVLGIILLIAGFAQIIHACYLKSWGSFLLSALCGVIYLIGGILLMKEPITGSLVVTIFLALCFCFGGILRIMIAMDHKAMKGWGMLLVSGILGLILGIILFISPINGLWLIGFMIAIDLIFLGIAWMQFGYSLKSMLQHPTTN